MAKVGEGSDVAARKGLLTLDQQNSSSDIFISISGLIGMYLQIIYASPAIETICVSGAGKTTLATKLAERMGLPCFYEPVIDNMYLADFYRDPKRYSFPLQVMAVLAGKKTTFTCLFPATPCRCTYLIGGSNSTSRLSGRVAEVFRTEPSTRIRCSQRSGLGKWRGRGTGRCYQRL